MLAPYCLTQVLCAQVICATGAQAKLDEQQRKRPKLAASKQPAPAVLRPPGSPAEQPMLLATAPAQPAASAASGQRAGGAAVSSGGEPPGGSGPEVCGTSGRAADERDAGTGAGVPAAELPRGHGKVSVQESAGHEGKASRPSALRGSKCAELVGIDTGAGSGQDPWRPDGGIAVPGAAFAPKGGLKQRKKDFLNRRKLKKRGGAVSEAAAGDRLERRLLQDPQRPAFGEQALAPLKVRHCA